MRRPVQGVASRAAADDDFVCHRGFTTEYSCGQVTSISYLPTYTDACLGATCAATWLRVEGPGLKCYPGDSGGPVFLDFTAYGFYKGQNSAGTSAADCDFAIVMSQQYLSEINSTIQVYLD